MKNLILVAFSLLVGSSINYSHGQNPYLGNVNLQLRSIFSQIAYPSSNVLFLYDRSAKLSDSIFYQNNSPDTLISTTWYQLYDEMYYAAHDTLPLTVQSDMEDYANGFNNDTIPMAIMDYDWYYCDFNSLETGTYFIFDTVNTLLYDKPGRPGWPFSQSNIFAASPLRTTTNFINPTFRIDPALFFSDNINSPLYDVTTFRIDFGDGTGWHYFDPNVVSHYQANYAAKGQKDIRVELLDERGDLKKGSNSTMNVVKSLSANSADYVFELPGLQVGVYTPCEGESDKFIIYLEGIDILDDLPAQSRGIDDIYFDMINYEVNLDELRNFNYTFFVVNWKNSTIDMRFNALHVVNLIEYLKRYYDWSDEQLVIIGESMGGVVARYALTYMESEDYQSDDYSSFFVEAAAPGNAQYLINHPELYTLGMANKVADLKPQMHKTRELITLDSPHQGANVPLSVQIAYKEIIGRVIPSFQKYTEVFNIGLEGHAAKQLLLYHLKGKITPLSPVSGYTAAPEHYAFYGQLRKMGEYPKFCKLMALSSAALNGKNQLNFDNTEYRTANDLLLKFEHHYGVRILGRVFPFFGAQFTLRTNPNGTGEVFDGGVGLHVFQIKLKWFGIKIQSNYAGIYSDNQIAVGVKPYCTSAGGIYSVFDVDPLFADGLNEMWMFSIYGTASYDGNGCVSASTNSGFNGLGQNNWGYSICTDGAYFGFVPLQSALDYGKGLSLPLFHDIQGENINTKLSRTPFDVIMGYPDGRNRGHLNYRDEFVYNVTGAAAQNCFGSESKHAYYDADMASLCMIRRSLLCMEIGDEEMYLENWNLNRTARFQAQYDLHVNERNPYYEYPSFLGGNNIAGLYSKEANFTIEPTGYAKFYYNGTASPTSIGFSYTNPQNPSLWYDQETEMSICLEDYATKSTVFSGHHAPDQEVALTDEALLLYPNPTTISTVNCAYRLKETKTDVYVRLIDASGRTVVELVLDEVTSQGEFSLDVSHLTRGVYFLNLACNDVLLMERLIIE